MTDQLQSEVSPDPAAAANLARPLRIIAIDVALRWLAVWILQRASGGALRRPVGSP